VSEPFIGSVILFAGNFAPRGWAFCDGQLLAISQNTALFSILGTTYGGNLLACRAALTFLDVLQSGLQDSVARVSAHLFARLHALQSRHPNIVNDVRGAGFIAGLDLTVDAQAVVAAALDRGLLINRTSTTVVRLLPPYIATEKDVDEAMGILDQVLRSAS
jgi:acetylornithine/succinyldiaminopimelate/putrescine aminotransferase